MMQKIMEIVPAVKIVTTKGLIMRIGKGDKISFKLSNGKIIEGTFAYLDTHESIEKEDEIVIITVENQIMRVRISSIEEIDDME